MKYLNLILSISDNELHSIRVKILDLRNNPKLAIAAAFKSNLRDLSVPVEYSSR
jgi:hypothetical protein